MNKPIAVIKQAPKITKLVYVADGADIHGDTKAMTFFYAGFFVCRWGLNNICVRPAESEFDNRIIGSLVESALTIHPDVEFKKTRHYNDVVTKSSSSHKHGSGFTPNHKKLINSEHIVKKEEPNTTCFHFKFPDKCNALEYVVPILDKFLEISRNHF